MSFEYKTTTLTGTTAADGSLTLLLHSGTLGYDPGNLYAQHQIQATVASGSWSIVGMTPNGSAVTLVSGAAGDDMVMVGPKGLSTLGGGMTITTMGQNAAAYFRFEHYRIVVTGGGDAQAVTVHIRSDAVAW